MRRAPYAGRLPQLRQHAGPRTCSRVGDGAVADCRCLSLTSSGDADGEEGGPEFSGDQDAVSGRVIGDAVEHGFFLRVDLTGWEDTCQVDLGGDDPGLRIDANDDVTVPHIGPDLAWMYSSSLS